MLYAEAFQNFPQEIKTNDRYNAACSWALAKQNDSAFVQLKHLEEMGYSDLNQLNKDPDLATLRAAVQWENIRIGIAGNREKERSKYNQELLVLLDSIYLSDQVYRKQLDSVEKTFGRTTKEYKLHWVKIKEADSVNLIKVEAILAKHGWLGADSIGKEGNRTLFLVIQHASIETQEKYLPMMQAAARRGDANLSSVALLEDRINLSRGRKQVYGSQIAKHPETGLFYVLPLEDPDHVDKRRAEVGLGPLSEYLARWKMTWDVEEYKRNLPSYMAILDARFGR